MANFQGTTGDDIFLINQQPITTKTDESFLEDGNPLNSEIITASLLAGDDNLNFKEGNDQIDGGTGNDTLIGGRGNDSLYGGQGNDFVSYQEVTSALGANQVSIELDVDISRVGGLRGVVSGETTTVDRLIEIENAIGASDLPNLMIGSVPNNLLIGGTANDTLQGGGGQDTLQGDLGDDLYENLSGDSLKIDDKGGQDTLVLQVPIYRFTYTSVSLALNPPSTTEPGLERQGKNLVIDIDQDGTIDLSKDIEIINFYSDATATTPGIGFIETVANLQGNDILNASIAGGNPNPTPEPTPQPTPSPTPSPMPEPTPQPTPSPTPQPGSELISWTPPRQNTNDPGLNSPAPGGGNTVFIDSNGVNAYVFGNDNDTVTVPGEAVGLYIQGLNGNDNITGTPDEDNINGNFGNDTVRGGAGNDGDRNPSIPAETIRVALRGGKGSDNLDGQEGDDLLNGNQDNDIVIGGAGSDIVRGGKGDDLLTGGFGDDVLIGDAGTDQLTGNEGADTFVLETTDTAPNSPNAADLFTDFVVNLDRIMLPANTSFEQLQLNAINLQVDNEMEVTSTVIEISTSAYAIVQGVTPDQLTANSFVPSDNSVLQLG